MPDYQALMLPMLRLIGEGRERMAQCLPALIEQFALSKEDAADLLPSGKQTRLQNRAQWARYSLFRAGLVEQKRRAVYGIAEEGRAVLHASPERIDHQFLNRYPSYREFIGGSALDGAKASDPEVSFRVITFSEGVTPAEFIGTAYAELMESTAAELLNLMRTMDPGHFERLVVDLLLAMGYGGGRKEMGQRLGRSGDGGIDGVIDEDALGLDAVYIQAKRYAPGNTVGSPAIREFIGSLVDRGASKGVFVTTSTFSKEAADLANRVQQRIVLLDGARLARLMIAHDVGVRTREIYAVKTVDEDYFADLDA